MHSHSSRLIAKWTFLIVVLSTLFISCKKTEQLPAAPPPPLSPIAEYARQHLPKQVYQVYNWNSIEAVAHGDSIISWMVQANTQPSNTILSLQITAANGKPATIIQHRIDSVDAIAAGIGKIFYETLNFSNNQKASATIDLSASQSNSGKRKEDDGGIRALSHDCTTCGGTLPGVIVYGKYKKKKVLIRNNPFAPLERVYVPIIDIGGGGGGGTGTGGITPDNTPLETINLDDYADFTFLNSIYLITNDYYPGKSQHYPWRWWETIADQSWANLDAAFYNIEHLRLAYPSGIWLANNNAISLETKQFLEENNLEAEALIAAKTLIEVVQQDLFYPPNTEAQVPIIQANYQEFACCLLNPINPAGYVKDLSIRMAFLKRDHPNWSWWRCYLNAIKGQVQFSFDVLGMVPVAGEVFDVANGIIYTIDGKGVEATLSFAATVPIVGWGATTTKWALKTIHFADGTRTSLQWFKGANNVISFGSQNSKQFRKALGLPPGDPRQAHHIIPWELANDANQKVIQMAAQSRFPFHPQDILNGIPLSTIQHNGPHALYTGRVRVALENIGRQYGNSLTPEIAYSEIVNLTNRIKNAILSNPTTPLNNLIF